MKTVLVTAIGSFSAAAVIRGCKEAGYRVVGADIYPENWVACSLEVDAFYQAPYATNRPIYQKWILELCEKEEIEMILPLTDVEVDLFADWTSFSPSHPVIICTSDPDTIHLCRHKKNLETFIRERNLCLTIPTRYLNEVLTEEGMLRKDVALSWPLVAKPFGGRSSQGLCIFQSQQQMETALPELLEKRDLYLIQPKIEGHVITVDVVWNPETEEGNCLARRELLRTMNGAGTSVCVFRNTLLEEKCLILAKELKIKGCINFEWIEDEGGNYHFLECNPRFSGGVAFTVMAGSDMVGNHLRCFTGKAIVSSESMPQEQYIARRYQEFVMKPEESRESHRK